MSYIIEYRNGNGITKKIVDVLPRNMLSPEQQYIQDFLPLYMLPYNNINIIPKTKKDTHKKESLKRKIENKVLLKNNKKRIKKPKKNE